MREDFIHYLWRQARFDLRQLSTTTGQSVSIQDFGRHNHDAGPDFLAGQVRLNGQQWAGNIEMHVKASDWYAHRHETDPAYENVILHVVYEEDKAVFRANGERIPCLELRGRVPYGLIKTYFHLSNNEYWIPCQNQLHKVDEVVKRKWLSTLLNKRVSERARRFALRMEHTHRDWEEAFYQSLARAMGGKVNADAMDMLARSVPLRVLLKHKHSLLQLEAILFGQSGLIPAPEAEEDNYIALLRREYTLLRTKYELRPLPVASWKYMRLRPANFPTVRIAQLAAMLHQTGQLFGKSLAAADTRELMNMYSVKLSNYWREHFRFGRQSKESGSRKLGLSSIRSILINTVVPAMLAYAEQRGVARYREQALAILNDLPPENNAILRQWNHLGLVAENAADSQALLELKTNYCGPKNCLNCAIGCALLDRPHQGPEDLPLLTLNEEAVVYGLAG